MIEGTRKGRQKLIYISIERRVVWLRVSRKIQLNCFTPGALKLPGERGVYIRQTARPDPRMKLGSIDDGKEPLIDGPEYIYSRFT